MGRRSDWILALLATALAVLSSNAAAAPSGVLYQLQNLNVAEVAASAYSLVVTDYSRDGSATGEWTPAEIEQLRAGGQRTVLAYFSIGEAEDYRYYWQPSWRNDPPSWLGPPNADWPGNYKVRYWDPAWQALLFGSQDAYLDRILDQGFDGIYLDIVDAYEYWGPDGKGERETAAADMVSLVKALAAYGRARRPEFLVVPQNGAGLGVIDPSYVETVDGIGAEDTWTVGNRAQSRIHTEQVTAWLDRFRDAGKTVIAVDYPTRRGLRDAFFSRAEARGYRPSNPPRALDRYVDLAGHPPAGGPAVTLEAPADGETVAPAAPPSFSWIGTGDAVDYRLVFTGSEAYRQLRILPPGRSGLGATRFTPSPAQWRGLLALAGQNGWHDLIWWVTARNASGQVHSSRARRLHTYHENISTTVFWIGEDAGPANGGIANQDSAWDECWLESYGGVDTPADRNGYLPAGFTPAENPFYVALPYNDLNRDGVRKPQASIRVPWAATAAVAEDQSLLKNRWVEVVRDGTACYGQWEDVGPFGENDARYVFGSAQPRSGRNRHAGLDVSPALRDCLGIEDGLARTAWRFVEAAAVPAGPWKQIVTSGGTRLGVQQCF